MNKPGAHFKTLCQTAMAFFLLLFFIGSAKATFFTVTKTSDTNDGVCNADCSLREAIEAANNQSTDDVIEFDSILFSTPQTITLLGGQGLFINNNGTLTINGRGANLLTISGRNAVRVFQFNSQSFVTLRRMTIRDGEGFFGAGCIAAHSGTVTTFEDVVVRNCRAFAPDPINTLVGGGIVNEGTMSIIRSRIEFNQVPHPTFTELAAGGGIYNSSVLTIISSSVNNNTANGSGGGIYNSSGGTLNLFNSTISGNTAEDTSYGFGGGIANGGGSVNATHMTIAFNNASLRDGGVSNAATGVFNSRNSIYSNNTVGANERNFSGTLVSGGYNLIKDATDTIINGDTTGNILNQDPQLQPLGNSGGSVISLYHKPAVSSPAIDNGKTFGIFADQRLLNRPTDNPGIPNSDGGDGADIGAIELQFSEVIGDSNQFDFDGDGKTDLSVFRPSNGQWWINRSSTSQISASQFGTSTDRLVPADFSGDRKTDIAVFRPSNGFWYIFRSENGSFYSFPFGTNEDIPAPGDFDGDGRDDPAVFRPSQGIWYIMPSSSTQISVQQFGISGDQPVVADYDGDGKDDIAIFRPSNGEWWVLGSSNGLLAAQFGQTGDKTVQGDYTGDGKADLAFWRSTDGFWYVLRSEDYSYFAFPFGSSGDMPVPGDYDGDRKSDAAVFRPSNLNWYLLRSTSGVSSQSFGIAGDYPVPNAYVR